MTVCLVYKSPRKGRIQGTIVLLLKIGRFPHWHGTITSQNLHKPYHPLIPFPSKLMIPHSLCTLNRTRKLVRYEKKTTASPKFFCTSEWQLLNEIAEPRRRVQVASGSQPLPPPTRFPRRQRLFYDMPPSGPLKLCERNAVPSPSSITLGADSNPSPEFPTGPIDVPVL